ncbi:hypothetical protein PB2503_06722 [Parvularcula bermudensis HTCC2503]|uniref:Uncharacterized protein n=1 Tax=Parvularcula bermudensis (strain ATCC BAA-594 / HTCC2503 / KCTC 12087) TaxID=314260 RepID=E0TI71_PARBH|nr:hypothetical protein [Parvularcula bermudensis]ADM09410.1 hypothetical protein PB2503_06722 [Parvularcula bermudensis HTCC2503]
MLIDGVEFEHGDHEVESASLISSLLSLAVLVVTLVLMAFATVCAVILLPLGLLVQGVMGTSPRRLRRGWRPVTA